MFGILIVVGFVISCFILSDELGVIVLKLLAFAFILAVLWLDCQMVTS